MTKSKLRRKILKIRKKNYNENLKIIPSIINLFFKNKGFKFNSIGGYYPCNFEIDDFEILSFFEKKNIRISLPVIKKNNQMNFFEHSMSDPFSINKYGISEPSSSKKVYPDIIFIPLVAFDRNLNRLGYGGGFYDRYLEKIRKIKKTVNIGLAFSHQRVKKIPISKFDKKLDYIITEKEIFE